MRKSVMKAQANQASGKKANMVTRGSLAKGDHSKARQKRIKVIEESYGDVPIR
jgi:hypothetical protein